MPKGQLFHAQGAAIANQGTDLGANQGTDQGADKGTDLGTDQGTDQGAHLGKLPATVRAAIKQHFRSEFW